MNPIRPEPPARSLVLLALLAGIAMAADPGDEMAIRAARAASNAAIARRDVVGIVESLDDDYQITTSLGSLSRGREEQREAWIGLFESRDELVYLRTPERIDLSADYPLAAETGRWTGTWQSAEGPVRTGGSYAAMWRKVDGSWKLRAELFVALYCEGAACP